MFLATTARNTVNTVWQSLSKRRYCRTQRRRILSGEVYTGGERDPRRSGRGGGGGGVWVCVGGGGGGRGDRLNLPLHCHHQNDSALIKDGQRCSRVT